ncbi:MULTISPECIES: heme peroxidase [Mycolicibacterium]|uniref:Heme peroxidase n=1 Tax=Mycolicibacterium mucogenicum TaxID=56689 RepID=A0A4R5WB56_MYCMU|nr:MULTISPECIES: heme peroxidase [Mycolicibacterium]TDK86504.1 heme peroxidase [Mycolicibacterium mucogenicum]UCZ63115.1 heme peroxidase [Mycolicibacterium phocaicum]
MNADIERLRAACERDLGDPAGWPTPVGYPDSLALCIIDAIYAPGARHLTVDSILERYRSYRAGQGGDADTDGAPELLANVEALGGPEQWAAQIGNRRPTSTRKDAPLRSVALTETAQAFVALGIRTTEDLRVIAADPELAREAKRAWCAVPGQRSGFTWRFLLMLAELPGTDPTVAGYVAREVGDDAADTAGLLAAVAAAAGWHADALHQAIWRFEARRAQELPSSA